MRNPLTGIGRGILWATVAATATMLAQIILDVDAPLTGDQVAMPLIFTLISLVMAAMLIVPSALLVGVPVVWSLSLLRWDKVPVLTLVGAAAGFALPMVLDHFWPSHGDKSFLHMVAFSALVGGGAMGAAWGTGRGERIPPAAHHLPPSNNRLQDERILR